MAARASKRHRRDRRHHGGIDPDDGNVSLTIGLDEVSHDLIDRESWTSMDVVSPTTFWFVTMSPAESTRNPTRVQSESTVDDAIQPLLPQQPDIVRGAPSALVDPAASGSATAFASVKSSAASRPATMSRVCLQ